MDSLPAELYGARELAEIDRRAGENGLSGPLLMQRAGEAAFRAIAARWPTARRWLVYAGGGNNGGDGYVVAAQARAAGLAARVAALKPPRKGSAAERACEAYRAAGGDVMAWRDADATEADLVVDALLGIGLDRAPTGEAAEAIDAVNHAGAPVAAIDLPSGLLADTGAAPGSAVRAVLTVTFIGLKFGLFTGAGPGLAGRLVFSRLDVPQELEEGLRPLARRIRQELVHTALPPRRRDAHKGRFGHVLVVGGELGMGGAVRMAGEAALRTGAGLVTAVTRPEHVAPILAGRPEIMVYGVSDGVLPAAAKRANVVALGPGLGQCEWGRALWSAALACPVPKVLDADGLNLLAAAPRRRDDWVLTPHPGEAGRLLQCPPAQIEHDRRAAVRELAERYGGVVILKGAGTLVVSSPEGEIFLCDRGNPGMATGGMGDALTGTVAGLLAQGLDAFTAARVGARVHAAAGDHAAACGERGMLAGDLLLELRRLVNP